MKEGWMEERKKKGKVKGIIKKCQIYAWSIPTWS